MQHPIFIGGCMRSGTTLFSTIIDAHKNIACGPETELFTIRKPLNDVLFKFKITYVLNSRLEQQEFDRIKHRLLKFPHVNEKMLQQYYHEANHKRKEFANLFFNSYASYKKKKRWADKTPGNTFFINDLARLYPNALFIHLVRDFRDVYLSLRKYQNSLNKSTNIFRAAYYWNRNGDLLKEARKYTGRVYILKYEDLLMDTEGQLIKICRFLEEDFDASCLKYYEVPHDKENKDHVKLIKKPIVQKNIGKYKNEMNHIEKLLSKMLCGHLLKHFGYEV